MGQIKRKPSLTELVATAIATAWNVNIPLGSMVSLVNDFGEIERTETTSEAWVIGGQTDSRVIVKVKGRAGGYSLDRIIPLIGQMES